MFITKPFVTDRRIRFALIGCGRISANHFDAIEKHAERAELVGVSDVDPAALAKAVDRTGAPGFRSLEDLLARTDAAIVFERLLARFPDWEPAGTPQRWGNPFLQGLGTLPLRFGGSGA